MGGAVGALTAEAGTAWLGLPSDRRPALIDVAAVRFTVHDWAVLADPHGRRWLAAPPERHAQLRRWAARVAPAAGGGQPMGRYATATMPVPAHAEAIARIRDWIAAGDLYQLNLTFALSVPWDAGGPSLHRRLIAANPGAAHAACVSLGGGVWAVSVSPETFLRTDGRRVVTRPIKGTRPRGRDAAADERLAAALRHSGKDGAEHVMIVDLERNDLARVCEVGTVRVPELAALEAHATVWHLTSTVCGELRPGVTLGELLAATFPCGSVTGAPKRMAVARIADVERHRRGIYCGALGVVTRGMVDLSVAIRTAAVGEDCAWYGTGGGIVAESRAADEHAEALHKAAAFLTATNAVPA